LNSNHINHKEQSPIIALPHFTTLYGAATLQSFTRSTLQSPSGAATLQSFTRSTLQSLPA